MKVALVFPGITDVGFNSFGDGIDGSWHSHGLMTLAACLKSPDYAAFLGLPAPAHDVRLIDLRRLSGWDAYRTTIAEMVPDLVCITMMSCDFNPSIQAAKLAHEVSPRAHVVVGGAHPSICPDEVLACPEFDTVVLKEGEVVLPRLLAALSQGQKPPRRIEAEPVDLDSIPFSDRTLFGPYEVPISVSGFEAPFMTFIAGRGCRYNCSFCQPAERKIFGRAVRRRSPKNFVAELVECQKNYGFRSALIHDDCLIEDPQWITGFVQQVRQTGLRFHFACQGRADLICRYPQMLDELISVGLKAMIVGFESGSDRVLRFLRKGVTREKNIQAGHILHEKGLGVWANYMMGVPTETIGEMEETISMLKEIKPDHYSPAIFTPHPGSDLFDQCQRDGLLLSLSHDSFRRNVTEAKIKDQDWHVIQWAVSESVKPTGLCTPYSKDYVSHWGDLENVLGHPGQTEICLPFQKGISLKFTATENLSPGPNPYTFRSLSTDPQFIFDLPTPLEPKQWRYIFVDVELSASSRGQFIWWTSGVNLFQATRHFRIPHGRHTFAFELARMKTYQTQIGNGISWNDHPVARLRFDPAESENIETSLHRLWLI